MKVFTQIRTTPKVNGLDLPVFLFLTVTILGTLIIVALSMSFTSFIIGCIIIALSFISVKFLNLLTSDIFVNFPKSIIIRHGRKSNHKY